MINLKIGVDLIELTRSFLTNQKVQLVIHRYKSKKRKIEIGIPQKSLVSPFFFLIYISQVFDVVTEVYLLVTLLSFVDDLGFIASRTSVKDIARA